jgi:glycosyltransferase involved in cell wall biosynthesis
MTPSAPAVSVLMAAHNERGFIEQALDSLLQQTCQDFEIVVVDDASVDGTEEVLRRYAASDTRVRVLHNETRLRLPDSLNLGFRQCRADLIARADADDVYEPMRLERQLAFLNTHPEIGVVSCGCQLIDNRGRSLRTIRHPPDHDRIRIGLLFANCLLHPGVVVRASVLRAAGGYDSRYWTAQDRDLWARTLTATRMANMPDLFVRKRIHRQSVSVRRGVAGQRLSASVGRRLLREYLGADFDDDAIALMIKFYDGFHLSALEVRCALQTFERVRALVRSREPADVARAHRTQIARAILLRAWIEVRRRPSLAGFLLVHAARWLPVTDVPSTMHEIGVRVWASLRLMRGKVPPGAGHESKASMAERPMMQDSK